MTSSSSCDRDPEPFNDLVKLPKDAPFSIRDIRNLVPKHCFERSYAKSFSYVLHDLLLVCFLFYAASFIDDIPYAFLRVIVRTLYWYVQGAVMTGLWVIAHECGHQAFSPSKFVNNCVGFVFHTMLLVPYFSWQYTHFVHHSRTNNLIEDTVHVPRVKFAKVIPAATTAAGNDLQTIDDLTKKRSLLARISRVFTLTVLGWPTYLFMNVTGSPKYDFEKYTNHFNPWSKLFPAHVKPFVVLSDAGLLAWLYVLYRVYCVIGFMSLFNFYVAPYFVVNFWLVTITFLHHTDQRVARYMPAEWNWMRGAFGTIDRDYGWFLNYCHHHIADTHLVHHLFSTIPHYHAVEATKALRESKLLGKYHLHCSEPFYVSLWHIIGGRRWCRRDNDDNMLALGKFQ